METSLRKLSSVAAAVLVLLLFVLGAHPVAESVLSSPWDKLAHLIYFGLFALLLHSGLGRSRRSAFAGAVLLAMADELHQIWLPGRHACLADVAADAIGALLALAIARYIMQLRTAA